MRVVRRGTPGAAAPRLLVAALAAGAGPAAAQSAEGGAPQQVQVTGQGQLSDTEQRRREPVAKTVYGRDELDKYGDTAVSDVLKRLPGVSLQGGNPRLRGLGAGYTLILINGEPAPPGFSLENLSPSQVERIEVTKGPTAEHSAQAVGGTINIILREPPRQRQRELRTGLGYTAARPVPSFTATYGDRFGPWSLSVPLSGFQWRGANQSIGERLGPDLDRRQQQLQVRSTEDHWGGGFNLGPRLNWRLSDTDSLNWQSFLQRNEWNNRGHALTTVQQGRPPTSVDDRWLNRGHWQMARSHVQLVRRWPDGARLEARAGVQASESAYNTVFDGRDAAGQASLARDAEGENRERGASTSGKWQQPWREDHTLALGWELDHRRRREVRSVTENGRPQLVGFDGEPFHARIERQAVFLQDEWNLSPRWSTYLGLRAERLALQSTPGAVPGARPAARGWLSSPAKPALLESHSSSDSLASRHTVLTPVLHLNHRFDPKGRDLLRASLTRSYRAPDTGALLGRPSVNTTFALDRTNTEGAPDRVGNPGLEPELATGLDIALEKYFANGGLLSLGLFHRRIDGLIRQQITLQPVPWASAPRYVSRPVNLARAVSQGLEFELKGRASELLPPGWPGDAAVDLRAAASIYRSRVTGIPGPDNRLESQPPWTLGLGFDHVAKAWPLTWGGSFSYTPRHRLQQTTTQALGQGVARGLDLYALWTFNRQASLRLSANNLVPLDSFSVTTLPDDQGVRQFSSTRRSNRSSFQAAWPFKF